ncbi:apses transcription factor-like protein [Dendryphion nanum]|uniref:Apses transcription factor-like protein n=1 Tax=Dendryphion nanum TaxID=256645 RepID=A0A9P9DBZ8_9PLEO|nr:apses transcription factor-like protein [Dendryphion nanum]
MVSKRTLPDRRNPLIDAETSPPHDVLVERRRLGQTNLAVKPGIAGLSNGSKAEISGTFDYAHLRVPLPKDLAGSGIFQLKTTTSYPESYFLMRRSHDGFISATGMFKAAFPWASISQEEAERRFQKTFPSAGPDEVAGSVWIAPEEAIQLSEEYGMRSWIMALLDPTPIEKGAKDRFNTQIQMPPRFDPENGLVPVTLPPTSALRPTRARSSRSASPSKSATPNRKIASPRKSRTTRSALKPDVVVSEEVVETLATTTATSALQNVVENGTLTESVASESVNGEVKEADVEVKEDAVHIEVEETVEHNGEVETTTTKVKIDVPVDHPELREPEDPAAMIAEATRMVQEATKELEDSAEASSSRETKSKRKAEELLKDEEDLELERPAKLARTETQQQLTKEKITVRALLALGLTVSLGAAVQYFA